MKRINFENVSFRKSGISPLISSVILIAFTIAIAIVVTGAITSMTKTQTEQATKASGCPGASLDIIETMCSNSVLSAVVVNAGQTDFKNFSITARIGAAGTVYTNSSLGDITLASGKATTLQANVAGYTGTISKLVISVGSCPGFSVSLTNSSKNIGTC